MKKLLIIFSLLFCVAGAKAQLTFEHKYDTGSGLGYSVRMVHFSSHGFKYVMVNPSATNGMIEIYNLNHSLYKQFPIPPQPAADLYTRPNLVVTYISDSLFNTNPSNFEYLIYYSDSSANFMHLKIYDDAGTSIYSNDSATLSAGFGPGINNEPVFYTPSGYKIRIDESSLTNSIAASIYALPGALPCDECSNSNLINAVEPVSQRGTGSLLNAYPNPAKNSTTIKYELPQGVNQGVLVFYNLQGQQVKTFTVDRTFDSLLVSTADLTAGTYFYVLRAAGNYVGSKKMVIIK
jgi:hypothetical protein